jgi:hypothetical protein
MFIDGTEAITKKFTIKKIIKKKIQNSGKKKFKIQSPNRCYFDLCFSVVDFIRRQLSPSTLSISLGEKIDWTLTDLMFKSQTSRRWTVVRGKRWTSLSKRTDRVPHIVTITTSQQVFCLRQWQPITSHSNIDLTQSPFNFLLIWF